MQPTSAGRQSILLATAAVKDDEMAQLTCYPSALHDERD
jgi:hypothetical protein